MTPFDDALARRTHWENHYREGRTPWDTRITPPEVRDFWNSGLLSPVGVALDMGCGTGTNVSFLASLGLEALGLELSHAALAIAHQRIDQLPARIAARTRLIQSDVASPPLHRLGAAYVLDIGCLHAVARTQRPRYAAGVFDNLAPGGYYHLFAHDRPTGIQAESADERGLGEYEVADLFTPALTLLTITRGRPDPRPCRWYLLRKPDAA